MTEPNHAPDNLSSRQIETCCSLLSSQAEEELFATGPHKDVWLLLEYSGIWGHKAFEESKLPERVKAFLVQQLEAVPGSRLLLIKRRPQFRRDGFRFFAALARETNPLLYAFHLDSYAGLLDLDIPALVSGDAKYAPHQSRAALFLVCTNGRRDACCGRFGLPLYRRVQERVGESVWQSSHVGGHRFAANLVCFPHALYYGRVDVPAAEAAIALYRQGKMDLRHYRGRAGYRPEEQAGEYYLRRQTGNLDLDGFQLVGSQQTGPEAWAIEFRELETGRVHRLAIAREATGKTVFAGCRQSKTQPVHRYRLLSASES